MQLTNIVLLLVSLCGLLTSYLLTKIVPEELTAAQKPAKIIQYLLFALITSSTFFYFQAHYAILFSFLAMFIMYISTRLKFGWTIHYLLLAPLIFLSTPYNSTLAVLLFLYGFPIVMLLKGNNYPHNR